MNAASRKLSRTANSRSMRSFWLSTPRTPGLPTKASSKSACFSGSLSLTMKEAGNASLLTSFIRSWNCGSRRPASA
ncbi:Uncharacterised protein [Mycobacteroides abscessus subsp. abscessus]|nr:Uncharacterised protein [Mycobacteroides abscessus subsp. abscessus]SKV04708.1 Uncharacterised protein [Mycobacteroides abscessus subsp. abscessus]